MCPVGVLPLWGVMKGALYPTHSLIVLYQTVWMGCLILGCIMAPPLGRSLNSVSATRPQHSMASYPEQHRLSIARDHSSSPVSVYRSAASLKGGHGECGREPPTLFQEFQYIRQRKRLACSLMIGVLVLNVTNVDYLSKLFCLWMYSAGNWWACRERC